MKVKVWLVALGALSVSAVAQEQQASSNANIEIKAGNIVSIAAGKDASAGVSIGVTPADMNENDIRLEIGDIFRAAFGDSAEAVIQLPATEEIP